MPGLMTGPVTGCRALSAALGAGRRCRPRPLPRSPLAALLWARTVCRRQPNGAPDTAEGAVRGNFVVEAAVGEVI